MKNSFRPTMRPVPHLPHPPSTLIAVVAVAFVMVGVVALYPVLQEIFQSPAPAISAPLKDMRALERQETLKEQWLAGRYPIVPAVSLNQERKEEHAWLAQHKAVSIAVPPAQLHEELKDQWLERRFR